MEHKHGVYDSDTRFSINAVTRQIKSDPKQKTVLMQNDHNSERFTFELPRYIEQHDMSICNQVEIHYLNSSSKDKDSFNKGLYTVDDLQISPDDPEKVVCSWLISQNATHLVGKLSFRLRFKCLEDGVITYAWHTAIFADISVSDGINADESFEMDYVDIIEQWKETVRIEFAQWHEETVDEMSDEITAWKEVESGKVRGEMTAFSAQWNDALNVERKRIDNLAKLPSGSTAGDAELMDIRVGANGNVYGSAGTAVREQIQSVSDPLCALPDETMITPEATAGKYVAKDTGVVTSGDGTLACTDAIKIPLGTYEILASGRGFPSVMPSAAFYDASGVYISGYNQHSNGEYIIDTIPAGSVYVRFCTYNPDGNTPISYKFHTMERLRNIERDIRNTGVRIPEINKQHCNIVTGVTSYQTGKFISSADTGGTIVSNTNFVLIDDYFSVEAGKTYNFVCGEPKIFSNTTHEWVFYDENKLVIESPTLRGTGVTAPENAVYLRFAVCVVGGGVVTLDNFGDYADRLVICENPPDMAKPFTDSFVTRMNIGAKKWVGVGDSLTEGNNGRATFHYFDYVCAETGLSFVNMGFSGSGYRNESSGEKAFWRRVQNMDTDADVITIFGGINDCIFGVSGGEIGTADDTGTDTVCGCVNTTIDNILALYPEHCPLGIISPLPAYWVEASGEFQFGEQKPMDAGCRVSLLCEQLEAICKQRGIPFLDLFHTSNLRPWVEECRNKYFSCDTSPEGDGLHLNSEGHRLIYRRIMQFVEALCN